MLMFVVGLMIASFVLAFWVAGYGIAATFLQLGFLSIGGALQLDNPWPYNLVFPAICLVIWLPFILRLRRRDRDAKIQARRAAEWRPWLAAPTVHLPRT